MTANVKKIKIFKKITNIMDLVGTILSGIATVLVTFIWIYLLRIINDSSILFPHEELSDLVGGYQVLASGLAYACSFFGAAFASLALIIIIAVLVLFMVPTIHGFRFGKKTNHYLEEGWGAYRKRAIRDSIIKLIFNAIPNVLLLYAWSQEKSFFLLGVASYFTAICVLEIIALVEVNRPVEETQIEMDS